MLLRTGKTVRGVACALLVFVAGATAATAATAPSRLGAVAAAAMAETGARGLAIAVIDGGRVTAVRTFGVRDAAGDPLTADTVMYGASLTKAVVGYLTVQLAAEHKLDLDRPLAELLPRPLPEYGMVPGYARWGDLAGDDRWRRVTARMVLNHSTGFANFAALEPDHKLRFHFEPGARYAYSGDGMMLLQFALEQGLGLDLGAELQRRIFVPLGATRTSLKWRPDFRPDLADGWDASGEVQAHDERSRVRAAGSMDTTPHDMALIAAGMVSGFGLPAPWRRTFAKGTLPITTRQQFPTLLPEALSDERPAAAAAIGVIGFRGPQGPGWYKGGHDDITANTVVCLERSRRCVVILANDVRAERAFPTMVRAVLGETGVPYRWEYPGLPSY